MIPLFRAEKDKSVVCGTVHEDAERGIKGDGQKEMEGGKGWMLVLSLPVV